MFLPDTNVFILGLRGDEPEGSFLKKAIQKNHISVSAVVIGEFFSKIDPESAPEFSRLLSQAQILVVDEQVAKVAAEMRRVSLKAKRVHLLDCFLAAQAKLHSLTLVTNNKADFPMGDIKVIVL